MVEGAERAERVSHLHFPRIRCYVTGMNDPKSPDGLTIISYLIAAAILIPIGWWLKENLGLADWLRSLFY